MRPSSSYGPAALFSPTASIGRGQYLASFLYQGAALLALAWLQGVADRLGGAAASAVRLLADGVGLGTFLLTLLAVRARMADAGMSPRWMGLPAAFLFVTMVETASGDHPARALAATAFALQIGVAALLLTLALAPGDPERATR